MATDDAGLLLDLDALPQRIRPRRVDMTVGDQTLLDHAVRKPPEGTSF